MHALLASTTCWAFTPHTLSNNRLYVYSQLLSITPAQTLPRTLHGSQSLVRLLAERCSGRTLVFGWLTTSSTRGIQSPSSCTHSSRGQASCQLCERPRVLVPERWRVTTPAAPGSVISVRCSPSDACRCGLRHRRRWCPWAWRHVMRHVWSRCLHHRGLRPGPSLVEVPTGSRVVSYRTNQVLAKSRRSRGRPSARNAYFLVISV